MLSRVLRWLKDATIIVAIGVTLVVLLEIGLRWYVGPPAYQFDDELIASLVPNASKVYLRSVDGGPRLVRWRTNADGFRGPALRDSKPRVIVYGDSNVQARFSTHEDSFTGQIERLLQRSGRPEAQVVNAGIVGFGPDQSLLRLSRELRRYEPDVVVFHVFVENDFGDIVRNRLFELGADGSLVRTHYPVKPDARMPTGWLDRPADDLLESSMISIFADGFIRGRARAREPHPELSHDPERFRRSRLRQHGREFAVYENHQPRRYSMFSDHYEADIAFEPNGESARTKRALLAAVLAEAGRITAEAGRPFLVVIQPTSRDLTTNLSNHHEVLAGTPGYDRRRLDRWARAICEDAGLEHVNLFDVFEATGVPNDLYFPSPDPHWNEAGQRVAAEAVAERLLEMLP